MKKATIILAAFIALIAACGNPSGTPADTNGKSLTTPGDSAKIDTVKPTDSIIKG
jgi:hypothetical protein